MDREVAREADFMIEQSAMCLSSAQITLVLLIVAGACGLSCWYCYLLGAEHAAREFDRLRWRDR